VIERRDREPGGDGWAETPTRNQKAFVSLDDGRDGLTIANRGLTEYEILSDRTVALTLVRAVGFLSRADLSTRKGGAGPSIPTPDAQCQRALRCEYALIAHAGDWRSSGAWREAQAFAAPPWSFRGDEVLETDSRHFDDAALSAAITFQAPPRGGELRDRSSLLSVDQDGVVLSALKPAETGGGLIARFYSIAGRDLGATVTLGFPAKRVVAVNLAEEEQREIPLRDDRFGFAIAHGDIATFLID
jgi:alpha-mannosidase